MVGSAPSLPAALPLEATAAAAVGEGGGASMGGAVGGQHLRRLTSRRNSGEGSLVGGEGVVMWGVSVGGRETGHVFWAEHGLGRQGHLLATWWEGGAEMVGGEEWLE